MAGDPGDDPVIASVAAYSTDPHGYERHYARHLLDRPQRFASLLPFSARVLDLGCGPGRDLAIFRAAGHRPIGIDLNPHFVEMARHHGEVITGDMRDVASAFPPETFDGIWAQASLVHLSAGEIERLLPELRSLLVPGGLLYACVAATGETGWKDEPDGRRWYTVWPDRKFATLAATAGFDIVEVVDGSYVELLARRSP